MNKSTFKNQLFLISLLFFLFGPGPRLKSKTREVHFRNKFVNLGIGLSKYYFFNREHKEFNNTFSPNFNLNLDLGFDGTLLGINESFLFGLRVKFQPVYSKISKDYSLQLWQMPLFFGYKIFDSKNWNILTGLNLGTGITRFRNRITSDKSYSYQFNYGLFFELKNIYFAPNTLWLRIEQDNIMEIRKFTASKNSLTGFQLLAGIGYGF